jgi:two-component system, NtrC family, response regulator AtoC
MRLLIVEDDAGSRHSLAQLLGDSGYVVETEDDAERALTRAVAEQFDMVLCSVKLPGIDGLSFLRRLRADGGAGVVIMLSGPGSEDVALAAMREGAYDYLQQPFQADEVVMTLRKAEERERLQREVQTLRSSLGIGAVGDLVVSQSRAMRDLVELASRVARHNTCALITGESGTGKEVIARAIHRMSPRSDRNFTAINCAAIPERLLESELFGHCKGAFAGATADQAGLFELVDGGTLLLDEIADLPQALQAKLFRVLEDGEVRRLGGRSAKKIDVRVLAATGRVIEQCVERGEFRSDLYYRLNVVRLNIPPLRERPEDIPELRNAVDRAAVLGTGAPLDSKDFALTGGAAAQNGAGGALDLRSQVEAIEREAIQRALQASNGNRRQAANLLGISLRTLFYKLRRLPVH